MYPAAIISAAILGLAGTVIADSMIISHYCFFGSCSHNGIFITSAGRYPIDGSSGCRRPGNIPGMTELCIDHSSNNRAHFRFSHQNFKRCLVHDRNEFESCEGLSTCWRSHWREVSCTWREAPSEDGEEEEIESVSATLSGLAEAETNVPETPSFITIVREEETGAHSR